MNSEMSHPTFLGGGVGALFDADKDLGDVCGLRFIIKKHIYLTECHFSFKIHGIFLI